ncbi:MAG: prolyl oligopeptidase family serine peptidase [Clostridiales bacterium]|jgi:predicted peptidase|nr:prolyl oligopeptidase family serine peptidase [Clostridiales bacterium]
MKNKSILHIIFLISGAIFIALLSLVHSSAYYDPNTLLSDKFKYDDFEIKYRAYIPDDYKEKKYPVVLYLHTAGEIGNDNIRQLEDGLPLLLFKYDYIDQYPAIYLFPQSPRGSKWVDVEWKSGIYSTEEIKESPSLKSAIGLVEYYAEEYNGDKNRIYVTGISMGGYGTWDLLARHPGVFAAAVPICGGADPEMAANISTTPVRAYHGDADDIVPPSGDIAVNKALKEINADAELTIIPGANHYGFWLDAYIESIDWMFGQTKNNEANAKNGETETTDSRPAEIESTESAQTNETSDKNLAKNALLISTGAIILFVICFIVAYKIILYIYISNRERNRDD